MKSANLAATTAITMIALLAHGAACATQPSAGGSGTVAVQNRISGGFSLGTNGTATSYAQNSQAATAKVSATRSYTPNYGTVNAGITGETSTSSFGKAYNVSTGSGSGWAKSAGSAETAVQGAAAIHGVTQGFTGGGSGTQTSSAIHAGKNQGSYVIGNTASGFDTQVHYARTVTATPAPGGSTGGTQSSTVTVSDQKTGYASGANSSGALDGMNAAGIANIGASGYFFAKAGLKAATGQVSAP